MRLVTVVLTIAVLTALAPCLTAQSANATISGIVQDPSGAAIPGASVTIKHLTSGAETTVATGQEGLFTFPNLVGGEYEIQAKAKAFRDFVQRGIVLHLNQVVRVPITMQLGTAEQIIEVVENVSQITFDSPEVKGAITRTEIDALPIQVAGSQRSAANFVTLLPGVSTGGTADAFSAKFNGGQTMSDEAVLDGVTMMEGLLSQSGMVAIHNDFPISPESVGEISVLTSNYDVRYGSSSFAVIVASTKEGTNEWHGGGYYYGRNEDFDARQWGAATKSKHREHDTGAYIGGPLNFPLLSSANRKSYIFVNFEAYRSRGSTNKPIYTVPTEKMRSGDFSEWPKPIYDPLTTRTVGGQVVRDQFMGCNGLSPNVICPSHPWMQTSLAKEWLNHVPLPNRPGLESNWEAPSGLASSLNANTNQWDVRFDHYVGEKDHFFLTYHYRGTLPFSQHAFPEAIDNSETRDPNYSHITRLNYDHVFSPSLMNHFAFGYLDLPTKLRIASDCCVDQIPKIQGVYSYQHTPRIDIGGYTGYGGSGDFYTTRPTFAGNDILSWVRGRHQMAFGVEYRNVQYPTHTEANGSGTFGFWGGITSLRGVDSGNGYADFLLGAVSSGSATFYTLPDWRPRGQTFAWFAGDTWKATTKLTVTAGLRWDFYSPSYEAKDRMSFFDPNGANPGAGGRRGRMAFAGSEWGEASYGKRYPEEPYYKAFSPRVGLAYALSNKTVVRLGYGVFFMQNFYPGWDGGVATDGFNTTASFSAGDGGLTPAFLLQEGFPQDFDKPPFITSTFLNGRNHPRYRPLGANRLPYAQQWNLTVERQLTADMFLAVGYVANKGTRLVSQIVPENVLDPKYLAMGNNLFDTFQPGQTELDGVPIPYSGWVEQMKGCSASVAQALLPYPQYCGSLFGQNENAGNSTYHSLQMKLEKRFSKGIFLLGAYTWSKTLTDADNAQSGVTSWNGMGMIISPFERRRNKALSGSDIPHVFSLALVYQLPVGRGKQFLNQGGISNVVLGGWQFNTITRINAGAPMSIRSGYCNLGGNFGAGCIPSQIEGANPWAQDKGSYDPNKGPLLNKAAFEPSSNFNFYWGAGPRVSNLRGFGYRNFDLGVVKDTPITESVKLQMRFEFFNLLNLHQFIRPGGIENNSGNVVNNDVASPSFGIWGGSVTPPRTIQLGGKVIF